MGYNIQKSFQIPK